MDPAKSRSNRGAVSRARPLALATAFLLPMESASAHGASTPAAAADAFLKTLAANGPEASWRAASPQFRDKLSSARWARYARASGLDQVRSAKWTDLAYKKGVAFLLGTVALEAGRTVPARFELIRVGPQWQIMFVDLKLSGSAYDAVRQPGVATDFH